MEIQNFQKFLGRPLVLVILEILEFVVEILDVHVFFGFLLKIQKLITMCFFGFLLKIQKFPCVFLDFC